MTRDTNRSRSTGRDGDSGELLTGEGRGCSRSEPRRGKIYEKDTEERGEQTVSKIEDRSWRFLHLFIVNGVCSLHSDVYSLKYSEHNKIKST